MYLNLNAWIFKQHTYRIVCAKKGRFKIIFKLERLNMFMFAKHYFIQQNTLYEPQVNRTISAYICMQIITYTCKLFYIQEPILIKFSPAFCIFYFPNLQLIKNFTLKPQKDWISRKIWILKICFLYNLLKFFIIIKILTIINNQLASFLNMVFLSTGQATFYMSN